MRRTAGALLLAMLAVACGRRGAPRAPELVQPLPPTSLVARITADGVSLTWHRPDKYSGGDRMRDLGGFDIDRRPADAAPSAPFTRVGHLELTDQYRFRQDPRIEWTDHDAEPGTRYQYQVTAFTLDGYRSPAAGPVTIVAGPGSAR